MARILIRIKRSESVEFFGGDTFRFTPRAVPTQEVSDHEENYIKDGEFFEIEERDVTTAIAEFARANPGCEVQAYTMTQSGICPPGDLVMKSVTKDGILPF